MKDSFFSVQINNKIYQAYVDYCYAQGIALRGKYSKMRQCSRVLIDAVFENAISGNDINPKELLDEVIKKSLIEMVEEGREEYERKDRRKKQQL